MNFYFKAQKETERSNKTENDAQAHIKTTMADKQNYKHTQTMHLDFNVQIANGHPSETV